MRIRLVLSVLALIAVPPRAEAALPQEIGQEFAVGKNIAGEECRVRLVAKRPEENDFRRYALFCRGWSQPRGHIRRFKAQRFEPKYCEARDGDLLRLCEESRRGEGGGAAARAARPS